MMTKSPFKDAIFYIKHYAKKPEIFYIKYYAKKHDCIIERKATLDENCFEGRHKKFGYPYKKYIDVWATEEVNNGQPQYRTESKSWEINDTQTL